MLNEQQLITASNETYLPNTSGLITAQRVRDFNNTDLIPTIFDISASLQDTINGIVTGTGFLTTQSFNTYTASQTAESASFNGRVDALQTSTASLNTFSQSVNTYTQSMNVFTSSYTTGSFTGSFSGDGSKLFGITASGAGVGILDEGIFQGAAVTLNFTGSNISASVIGGIATINVATQDVNTFLSKSTFEAYTASVDLTFATDTQLSASASTLQDNINSLSSSVAVTDLAQSSSIAQLLGFSASLDSTYATDAQLSASVSALSSSVTVTTNGLSSSIGILDSEVNALQQFSSSLDATFATDTQLSASASTLQNNINTLSSSVAVTDLAQSSSIAALQQFSSSLDSTFATDTQLSASASTLQGNINSLSSSVAVTTLGLSSSVAALQSFSSSLDNTFATDAQLSASASTLQNDINSRLTTASFNSYTASASSDVSSSVSQSVSALSQSVAVTTLTINGKLGTGSFESYTSSNDAKVNSLIEKTGSYATTGSNTFIGNQIISGNLNVSGAITATSGTFQYVETIFETASTIYSSGSNQFGDASDDVQTLYGSVNAVNRFTASGLNYPTADGLVDQFLSTNGAGNLSFSNLDTILEDVYTGEAITKGDPLYISGSQGAKPIVYKADAAVTAKMPVTFIAYETIGAAEDSRGIVLGLIEGIDLTGYVAGQTIYVAEGGGYSSNLPSGSNSITQLLGVITKGGNGGKGLVLNPGPAQLPGLIDGYVWVGNSSNRPVVVSTSSLQTDTGAYLTTSSFNSYTASAATNVSGAINSATSSLSASLTLTDNEKLNSSSFNSYTASQTTISASFDSRILNISGTYATTASNTFTGLQTLNGGLDVNSTTTLDGAVTASKGLNVQGMLINTGSNGSANVAIGFNSLQSNFSGDNNVAIGYGALRDATGGSDNVAIGRSAQANAPSPTVDNVVIGRDAGFEVSSNNNTIVGAYAGKNAFGFGGVGNNTLIGYNAGLSLIYGSSNTYIGSAGGLAVGGATAASASNHIILSDGGGNIGLVVDSNRKVIIDSMYSTGSITASNFVGTASFATTASFALNAGGASDRNGLITTGSSSTSQSLTGSLIISGATFNGKIEAPALSVGVTNLDTLFESTASGVPTTIDVTRLGAGPTGDLSGVRLQTLSGSDTTGDTLLSRINTGVNRHTSTAMTGSVVNTQITSTWATGSAGGRVAYSSQIIANAQSASATLTLSAGAGATLAGGTASLAAGLVRLGSNAAHTLSSTGSFGPMVIVGSVANPAISVRSGSVEITTPQGSGSFYSNVPITSSGLLLNGLARFSGVDIIALGGAAGSGSLFVENAITASVISASQYIGLPSGIISSSAGLNVLGFATTGSNTFVGDQTINAKLVVSASNGGSFINGGLLIQGDNLGDALTIYSGSVAVNTPQGQGSFYSNLPITSSAGRFNGQSFIYRLNIQGAGDSDLQVERNASISGSLTVSGPITGSILSSSFAQTASFALNAGAAINTGSFATTGSNTFIGTQTISGSTILSGSVVISGSAPVQQWVSGGLTLSGSLLTNATDIYTGSNNANFIVTLGSASMASLIAAGTTNPNTLYFVI